MDMMT